MRVTIRSRGRNATARVAQQRSPQPAGRPTAPPPADNGPTDSAASPPTPKPRRQPGQPAAGAPSPSTSALTATNCYLANSGAPTVSARVGAWVGAAPARTATSPSPLTSSSTRHHDDLTGDRRENEPSTKGGAVQRPRPQSSDRSTQRSAMSQDWEQRLGLTRTSSNRQYTARSHLRRLANSRRYFALVQREVERLSNNHPTAGT
jgi:hypothetical protein